MVCRIGLLLRLLDSSCDGGGWMSKNIVAVQHDSVVVSLQRASTALAEAKTIQQTKQIIDVATAAEIYAKRQELGEEAIGIAHSIKLEALRKLGEILKDTPKNEGAKGLIGGGTRGSKKEPRVNDALILAQLGLDKKTSSIAQKLANLSDEAFGQVRDGHETIAKAIAAVSQTKPASQPSAPVVIEQVEPEQEFEDCAPTEDEISASLKAEADQIEYIKKLLESDDPLAQALFDVKRYKEAARIARERLNGIMNEKNELIRLIKSLQAKLAKLEKGIKE